MNDNQDGSVPVCVYRLAAGTTKTQWQVVARPELAQSDCDRLNVLDRDGGWVVELLQAKIPITQIRPLIGYLCGSQTGGQKAEVARVNGKKGGRPKKPIDGLFDSQNSQNLIPKKKEVIEANLPPQ
jgi:hypothetical protein